MCIVVQHTRGGHDFETEAMTKNQRSWSHYRKFVSTEQTVNAKFSLEAQKRSMPIILVFIDSSTATRIVTTHDNAWHDMTMCQCTRFWRNSSRLFSIYKTQVDNKNPILWRYSYDPKDLYPTHKWETTKRFLQKVWKSLLAMQCVRN